MMFYLILFSLIGGGTSVESEASQAEAEARRFRIHVYQAYRTERPEFDRRVEASRELMEAWELAGRPDAFAGAIIDWHQSARGIDDDSALPALPKPMRAVVQSDPAGGSKATDPTILDPTPGDEPFTITGPEETATTATSTGRGELDWGPSGDRPDVESNDSVSDAAPGAWRSLGRAIWVGLQSS